MVKRMMYGIVLGSLLLAAACAGGGYGGEVQTYRPTTYPVRGYPDYYGPSYYPDQDPQFWQMWQDSQGGGGG